VSVIESSIFGMTGLCGCNCSVPRPVALYVGGSNCIVTVHPAHTGFWHHLRQFVIHSLQLLERFSQLMRIIRSGNTVFVSFFLLGSYIKGRSQGEDVREQGTGVCTR